MTIVSDAPAPTALQLVPLTRHIGCAIEGIDLRKPIDRPDDRSLRAPSVGTTWAVPQDEISVLLHSEH